MTETSASLAFYLRGIGFAVGGALFWLMYFDLKDRLRPEPRRLLSLAFLLGALAAVLALLGYRVLDRVGVSQHTDQTLGALLRFCVLVIGPVEEGVKFLVTWQIVTRWKAFDEPVDGLVYAAAVAIGFATLENLLYLAAIPWHEQLARSLTSPLTHSLFAAIWGYGLARARFHRGTGPPRLLWIWGTLILSAFLHGVYDFTLFAWNATYIAGGIALVLWLVMILNARRLVGEI